MEAISSFQTLVAIYKIVYDRVRRALGLKSYLRRAIRSTSTSVRSSPWIWLFILLVSQYTVNYSAKATKTLRLLLINAQSYHIWFTSKNAEHLNSSLTLTVGVDCHHRTTRRVRSDMQAQAINWCTRGHAFGKQNMAAHCAESGQSTWLPKK
jgi:hypothetical protein